MNILSLTCDNLFLFKDFSIDFTYKNYHVKKNFAVCKNDALFADSRINVRKRVIVLGGNASGKTTFGKLLCAINNFIVGRDVKSGELNLYHALYDANKKGSFSITFVIDVPVVSSKEVEHWAYRIGCSFDIYGNREEFLQRTKVYKSYNIDKLKEKLDAAKRIEEHVIEPLHERQSKKNESFGSVLLKNPQNKQYTSELSYAIGFHYIFSNFADNSQDVPTHAPIKLFNQVLPVIDNSISGVDALATASSKVKTSSYLIRFKNGDQLTVPDNNLLLADRNRLSHGTYEVLAFLGILDELKNRKDNIFYMDEQLAHLHAELEAFLVMKMFHANVSAQMFFTSHDNELLELNVPPSTYLLFKRNDDQYNTARFMDEMLSDTVKDIRYYYDNDYFGVLPDYSVLDAFFSTKENDHGEE